MFLKRENFISRKLFLSDFSDAIKDFCLKLQSELIKKISSILHNLFVDHIQLVYLPIMNRSITKHIIIA